MYRRQKLPFVKFFQNLNWGLLLFIFVVVLALSAGGVFLWFSRDLPDPGKVVRDSGYSSKIFDRTGKTVLYDVFIDQNREFVPIEKIPTYLKQATVAVEDKEFYSHKGFDPMAALRIVKNLLTKGRLIGGSTLTQQLVKTVLLTNERSVTRKLREFILAMRLEKRYSKDQILQFYLNEVPYGGTAWGVSAAASQYFGKDIQDLSLTECVILAGLPQLPSKYSPYSGNPKAFIPRAKEVARRMREDGYITKTQEGEVVSQLDGIKFRGKGTKMLAPHFVTYVKQQLEDMYGNSVLESGGLKVYTSLDWELQSRAENIVKEEVDKVTGKLNIKNGASVILDTNNGEILSMVGSKDYFEASIDGEVNVALRPRQPGSSIKPLVYATAFLKGYTPAAVLADVVTEFPGKDDNTPYIPKDYDGKERGLVHLRDALGSSLNVPAVKLLALVGVDDVLNLAYKLGLTTLEPSKENLSRLGLSMALGGGEVKLLELASAYSAFSNGGYKVEPVSILKIVDGKGRTVFERKPVNNQQVLDIKVSYLINSVLSDNNARLITFSPNSLLNLGNRAVAVKTGTTNDLRDNWTIGWTRDTMVGVWVGNNDNEKMKNVASGVSGAGSIWRREILDVLSSRKDKPFERPVGVVEVDLDKVSGYPSHDGFPSYKEVVIDGTLPSGPDPIHTKLKICKGDSNRLADLVNIQRGNYDEKEYVVMKEKDPLTPKDLWQKGINDWILKQTDPLYKPPTETCSQTDDIDIQFLSPTDKSRVDGEVTIRFAVASGSNLTRVELKVDDSTEQVFESQPYIKKIQLSTGNHQISVLARNSNNKEASKQISFGVNQNYIEPTPIVSTFPTPSTTPTP